MFEYTKIITKKIEEMVKDQEQQIVKVSQLFADCIINDKIIHVFGTGHSHMIPIELFIRAGGLANVNAMLDPDTVTMSGAMRNSSIERLPGMADIVWDNYSIQSGDIILIVSNSGRNAVPIEMALRAKKEGITSIALTSLEQSKQFPSRHDSGKKLYELCDYVLDNHVPSGDGLVSVGHCITGAFSSISGMILVNTIVTEAAKIALKSNIPLPILASQNIDGADSTYYTNEELYEKYQNRLKHL